MKRTLTNNPNKEQVHQLVRSGKIDHSIVKVEKYSISYLNAKDMFRETKQMFFSYETAVEWGRANLENFHIDMVHLER